MGVKAVVATLAVLAFAAPASGTGTSGLRGIVERSPTRPVCVVDEPCSAPAKDVGLVFARKGYRSVTTRTDVRGHYRVVLAPGVWSVRTPAAPRVGTGLSPKTVRVYAGRFTAVDFEIDTGIR